MGSRPRPKASEADLTSSYKLTPELEIAPVRNMNDFLLGSARFQSPTFNDLNRWSNRILNNLLYYQSNYFIVVASLFLIIALWNPRDIMVGLVCLGVALGIAFYFSTTQTTVVTFKKEHPLVSLAILVLGACSLFSLVSYMMVFIFSLAFPLLVALTHASLRMRNMKNKIANQAEAAGVTKTVMGRILDELGMKPEVIRVE